MKKPAKENRGIDNEILNTIGQKKTDDEVIDEDTNGVDNMDAYKNPPAWSIGYGKNW